MSIKVGCRGDLGERERDLLACLPAANIEEATSVCTGGSNMPPAYCDLIIRVPSGTERQIKKGVLQNAILQKFPFLKVRNSGRSHEQIVVSTAKILGLFLEKSILQQTLFVK